MFRYALSHRAQSTIEHITSRDFRFGQPSFPVGRNWFVSSLGRDAGHNIRPISIILFNNFKKKTTKLSSNIVSRRLVVYA